MHAVAAFFASIIAFVSGFLAPPLASDSPTINQASQPAAAAVSQTELAGNSFNDHDAASAVAAASAAAPASALPPPPQTNINQPVIERIVERVVPQGNSGISADKLAAILTDFGQSIENRIAAINPPKAVIPQQVAAAGDSLGYYFAPASQRIDQLTNTAINSPTITGGAISGANIAGYLALSGGALTGALSGTDLTLSGVLAAGTLNVGALSSSGALIGPYFNATSTTATSTFAGPLAAGTLNLTSALSIANGGTGTTTATGVTSVIQFLPSGAGAIARSVQSKLTDTVSVKDFGAVGDGATDDTLAINAAITYANALGGGDVIVPPGTYMIDAENTSVLLKSNVDLRLAQGATLQAITNSASSYEIVKAQAVSNAGIFGGAIRGERTTHTGVGGEWGMCIDLENVTSFHIVGTYISNCWGDGIYISDNGNSATPSRDVFIERVTLDNNRRQGLSAIHWVGGSITDSVFENTNGTAPQFGIDFEPNTPPSQQVSGISIHGNRFINNSGGGVLLASGANANIITNNTFSGSNDTAFIKISGGANNSATNNILSAPTSTPYGIRTIAGSTNNSFISNQFIGSWGGITKFSDGASESTMLTASSSNIGIGTTEPGSRLSVLGGSLSSVADQALNVATALTTGRLISGLTGTSKLASLHTYYNDSAVEMSTGSSAGYVSGIAMAARSTTGASEGVSIWTRSAQRVTFDWAGNVGIGTTSPTNRLEVAGNTFLGGQITGTSTLALTGTTGTTTIAAGQGFTIGGSQFVLQQGSGYVGIGTTTPSQKLDVQGSARLNLGSGGGLILQSTSGASDKMALYWNNVNGTEKWRIVNDQAANLTDDLRFYSNAAGTNVLTMLQNGNVGIGTTTPGSKLVVQGTGTGHVLIGQWAGDSAYGAISLNGSLATGNANFYSSSAGELIINRPSSTGLHFRRNNGSDDVIIDYTGNVGIGTTTPTAQLSTTGTVRFAGLGSGGANLVTDALGNVTASSDERLKDKQGDFIRGLAAINAISPVLYKWRPETGFDTQSTYAGFFAQNVQAAIPEAVSEDSRGYLTLADRPILAALVNATKEIAAISGVFKDSLIAWLADASNGITAIFARDIFASNVAADNIISNGTLCIRDGANDNAPLCLTKSELAALLSASGASQGINVVGSSPLESDTPPASPTDESDTSPQAPVLALNGKASSTIDLGDTYNDLGARIVAPTSDLNLGLVILLDGATTTQVSIDTNTPGEHTILYTVTSPTTGLTSSVIRTVIIAPIEQSPEQRANDNPFNAAPANDNASSTAAIDTAA